MKNKIITLILTIGLAVTSYGWVIDHNQTVDLKKVISEQKVDLNEKSTEIANLEVVIVEKDDSLMSKDMVIDAQDTQINKQKKKIQYLEDNIQEYIANFTNNEGGSDGKPSPKYTSVSRQKTEIKYSLTVNASAYIALCDSGCSGKTATGYDVRNTIYYNGLRVIAVDPSVIPLYSIVEIEGFKGRFIAIDTGGLIKGNKIDILVSSASEANKFGRKNLKVDVIRHGI